jgi:hypothetical protein
MPTHTHETAPTRYVEADGIRFAYRRFGGGEGLPLLFCQHFTGTMDNWDPIITNTLAQRREMILFDNRGVGSSTGQTPNSVQAMATDALAFVDALGLKQIDRRNEYSGAKKGRGSRKGTDSGTKRGWNEHQQLSDFPSGRLV